MERAPGDFIRARLRAAIEEPARFALKQLWAGRFGGVLMVAIALATLLWLRLETREEVVPLLTLSALGLEWDNSAIGHRTHPEPGHFALSHVPLLLSALGVRGAETRGTFTGTWTHDGQSRTELVSVAMLDSWFLFLSVALMVALMVLPKDVTRRTPMS